jgi:DNA-binding transcriptional MocR family regulator
MSGDTLANASWEPKIGYLFNMTNIQIIQSNPPEDFIDLGIGNPDNSLLPLNLLQRSVDSFFTTEDKRPLQYGYAQGDGYFREALGNYLSKAYGMVVDPSLLFVTTGASPALDLLCSLFTQPDDIVFVEEPTYFLALRIFNDHRLKVVPIPRNDDDLFIEILEKKAIELNPKLIYIIPTFQNPSGHTFSERQREKIISLAQRRNIILVADEVYHLLAYDQLPPKPLAAYAESVEQIISVNSFSKILAPGIRLGWIQAHTNIINRLVDSGLLESGGGLSPFSSALIRHLIESGDLEENIKNLRQEYSIRLDAMGVAILRYLPESRWVLPQGGFFFWIRLPGIDGTELRNRAKKHKVGLRQGQLFSSQRGLKEFIRLSFCFYPPNEIDEGIFRLNKCLKSLGFQGTTNC